MGVKGLMSQVEWAMKDMNVRDLKTLRVAVDAHSWLHIAALNSSEDLCEGKLTTEHINFFLDRAKLLLDHEVTPIFVFDEFSSVLSV